MPKTLQSLISSTRDFKPVLFQNATTVSVQSVNITRQNLTPSTARILFSGVTKDTESPSGRRVQMQFIISGKAATDIEEYVPSMTGDKVQVRSTSPFYKYAFSYNNKNEDAHFGRAMPFRVKGTGRPVNPKNFPGLDKHLLAFANTLENEGLISQ